MVTEVKNTNYWISSSALYIQLNAMGEPDYIQSSVVSGTSILCYMNNVPGLGYDVGHNYQRWTLASYPSIFPDSGKKYIYVAIPRVRTGDNDIATVVFPSQRIDIYGKAIIEQTKEDGSKELATGAQIGNENFYYIYLQGIISEVKTDADGQTRKREWEQHVDCGSLATDEALASGGEGSWWKLNSVSDTITFLKTILKADFEELTAKVAKIGKLALNGRDLTGVADETTFETSDTTVVTPQYLGQFGVKHFLAKDKDDTAKGTIIFEKVQKFLQGLTAEDLSQFKKGATFGEFIQGMLLGTGGRIDGLGNAEFESITSRSSIIAKELIVNRQTAMESNFMFTESGLVETVTENAPATEGDNITYDLKLQKRWDGDFTAFRENDVVLASVNTLSTGGGLYYDTWLRVLSVNTVSNVITVVCYPDSECPSGRNFKPCELARLIRWGNAVDEERQSCWYISSSEGILVWLDHVTKPIIDRSNYSIALGRLPDALSYLFKNFPLADKRDGVFYAKWMMANQFQQIDYQGNVTKKVVDRGLWNAKTAKEVPYRNIETEVHDVWHYGCRWRCLIDSTQDEPKYASTGWAFVEGNPTFSVEMTSEEGWDFDYSTISKLNNEGNYDVFTTLSFDATLYNRSVKAYVEPKRVTWTRDTGNPAEDNTWAVEHASAGLSVDITWKDLGTDADMRSKCSFRVEVELIDETVQPDGQSRQIKKDSSEVAIL